MRRWRFLAVISAAQLALLFAHLGRDSLWLDEVTSADVAGAPWGRVWAFFRSLPEQHPLYYLLLRGWTILGTSEATLRSLSVVLAIATVWALYVLVERLAGERTARVAAVIAAADRKSTRLNSSHLVISYAVFCLKKKRTSSAPTRSRRSSSPRALRP